MKIGEYTFDTSSGELFASDGAPVPLRAQSLSTLSVLAERPGEVVSKDDIVSRVWKDFAVTDDSLTQCISDIRRALGAEAKSLLQTLPKRGYRLNAEPLSKPRSGSIGDAPIKYARIGDRFLAYQVFGDSETDLILVPAMISHLEKNLDFPIYRDFITALAEVARVIAFDKTGQGMSDPAYGVPSFQDRVEDIAAIMDAVGSRRATLLGNSEGAALSVMFAALHPRRVERLILMGGFARFEAAPDYPYVRTPEEMRGRLEALLSSWGTGKLAARAFLPSHATDEAGIEDFARLERATYSPGALRKAYLLNADVDIRSVLPNIECPTLVMHREEDASIPVANGHFLAEGIPNARFVALTDADDHLVWGGHSAQGPILSEVTKFLKNPLSDAAAPEVATRLVAVLLFEGLDTGAVNLSRRKLQQLGASDVFGDNERMTAVFTSPERALSAGLERFRGSGGPLTGAVEIGLAEVRPNGVVGPVMDAMETLLGRGPGVLCCSLAVRSLCAGAPFEFLPVVGDSEVFEVKEQS